MAFKQYRKTSNYGWRNHPDGSGVKFHAGIDLVKRKGGKNAPIEAFLAGYVLYSGFGKTGTGVGGFGNVVVIRDAKGYANVYAHLDSVSVKKGDIVNKGQVIGRQGATGNFVTGEHLHYEVRKTSSPSLGWTSSQANSTVDPEKHVQNFAFLKVDGSWGPATTRADQNIFGTTVDGEISGQPSNISIRNIPAAKIGKGGSDLIEAMQKWAGTPVDRIITTPSELIGYLQKRYKTKPVDKYVSRISNVVKAKQSKINRGEI